MNMEENSLLWEHCEDPYHINDYTMKYTDYEYLINYKDNEYYVDVTYTIEILQIDEKFTIEKCKIESFIVSDENGEVNIPKEDILPMLPSMSEEAKAKVLKDVRRNIKT